MCSHSVVKLYETTPMFLMVDYVRELTVKKSCKYGEYGSFEHFTLLVSSTSVFIFENVHVCLILLSSVCVCVCVY